MAINTTAPYKSGTLSSIGTGANGANTRLNTSGITWASSDIGRHVYFINGNARWESREIIGQGTNFCDILFPFGEYPVLKPDGTEVPSDAPSVGDTLGVSYKLDDLDDGTTLVKDNDNVFRHVTSNAWTIGNEVMIHDTNKMFYFDSSWIDLDGIMQLGNLDKYGNPINSCSLTDICSSTAGFSFAGNLVDQADDFGSFRLFGGSFIVIGSLGFLRLYRQNGTSEATQVHGVNFDGAAAGRFDGTKSYFLKNTYSNMIGGGGPINPKANIAMIKDIVINSGEQAAYHFWQVSQSITIPGLRFNPLGLTTRFCRINSFNAGSGYTLTFDDILINDIQTLQDNGLNIFDSDANISPPGNNVVLKNPLTVKTQNQTPGYRLRVKNASGIEQYDANSDGSGNWAKASYDWGSVNLTSAGNYDLDDFTKFGPYDCNARKYNRLTQTFVFDALEPLSTVIPDVVDSSIIELNEATVAAYTALDNADKLRDRIKLYHLETDGFEDLTAGGGSLSLVSSTNVNSVASYNLTIDPAAGSVISESGGTITIKCTTLAKGSTYTNLIVPSGKTLTLLSNTVLELDVLCAGSINVNDIDELTGTLTLTGSSTVTVSGTGGGTFPSGSAGASSKIVISASVADDTFNADEFVFDASTVIENTSGNNINIGLAAGQQAPVKLETSGTITFVTPEVTIDVTAPNLIDGTRVRLYNVTQTTEIDNTVVSGGSGYSINLTEGVEYNSGNTLVILGAYQSSGTAKEIFRASSVATTSDITFSDSQVDWVSHNLVGIDGSTVSECSTNYGAIQVEVNDADNSTTKARIAAFIVDALTTADGIRNWVSLSGTPIISYKDSGNAEIDVTVASLKIDNIKATPLDIVDSFKLRASNGSSLVDDSTYTINFDNTSDAVVVETGVSGLTSSESANLAEISAVKITTDKLDDTLEDDLGVYRFTANALEQAPAGGGGTTLTAEQVRIEMDANSTKLAEIVADTNELQTNQGNWVTATGFSTFDPATDTVTTDLASREASKADVSGLATQASVDGLNDISVADIEASTVLAKEATVSSRASQVSVDAIPTTDSVADLTPVLTAISALNDPTPAEIRAVFNEADFKDKNTELEIHTWLDSYLNKDDWKGDGGTSTVDLTPVIDLINGLNDFDPATDTVARVTLVDTTTTNTDMRGTDGASTVDPDNASIAAIKERTDNLPDDPASNSTVEESAFL